MAESVWLRLVRTYKVFVADPAVKIRETQSSLKESYSTLSDSRDLTMMTLLQAFKVGRT